MPGLFGLSHTARGRDKIGSNGAVIEAVESVQSVDLVGDPATVAGLYESRGVRMRATLRQLQERLNTTRPAYASILRRIAGLKQSEQGLSEQAEAGIVSPDMPMDEPPPAEAPPEGDHEQAILDAATAVLNDSSLDSKAKLDKIKKLLSVIDGKEPKGESEAPTEESVRAELATYKLRERIRNAADTYGVKVPPVLLETLKPSITDAQIKTLVESLRGSGSARGGGMPRSAAPVPALVGTSGQTLNESKIPDSTDPKSVGRWLNQGGGKK